MTRTEYKLAELLSKEEKEDENNRPSSDTDTSMDNSIESNSDSGKDLNNFKDSGFTADFEGEILKKAYENEVGITKDNVHLYYELMSDEDKYTNSIIIHQSFYERNKKLELFYTKEDGYISIEIMRNIYKNTYVKEGTCYIGECVAQSYFGVKDTMKPIEEYIEEIKASEEYHAYISSTEIRELKCVYQ